MRKVRSKMMIHMMDDGVVKTMNDVHVGAAGTGVANGGAGKTSIGGTLVKADSGPRCRSPEGSIVTRDCAVGSSKMM